MNRRRNAIPIPPKTRSGMAAATNGLRSPNINFSFVSSKAAKTGRYVFGSRRRKSKMPVRPGSIPVENVDHETGVCAGTRIAPQLRTRVSFDQRDLTREPPPATDFDMVLCRRLLPYLTPQARAHAEAALAHALTPGGVVVLGRDETLTSGLEELGLREVQPGAYRKIA